MVCDYYKNKLFWSYWRLRNARQAFKDITLLDSQFCKTNQDGWDMEVLGVHISR